MPLKTLDASLCGIASVFVLQFKEGQLFMVHLENLLHLKSQLCEKEKKAQTQVDQQRKALRKLEDQHHLLKLHTTNQLYQLHKELEKVCSEALTWVWCSVKSRGLKQLKS